MDTFYEKKTKPKEVSAMKILQLCNLISEFKMLTELVAKISDQCKSNCFSGYIELIYKHNVNQKADKSGLLVLYGSNC